MTSVGPGILGEMIGNCENFIDGKAIRLTDVDLAIIACNGGNNGTNKLSPGKALVRHQMIEALVRLSLDKFHKTKEVDTPTEAVERSFEEHFLPHFSTFNCHEWRKERLWKQEIDVVYTRFFDKLELIYKKFTGKYMTPATKPTMSHEEFVSIFEIAGLLNEHFANR